MKTKTILFTLVITAGIFAPAASCATILIGLDPFSPTGLITPNSANVRLGMWDITAPNVEGINILDMIVGVQIQGSTLVQNLMLMENGTELGQILAGPSTSDAFYFSLLLPANYMARFELRGDVGVGDGTIQTWLTADGVNAVGITSLDGYTGPAINIYGSTLTVGKGASTPEPGTPLLFLAAGTFLLPAWKWRRVRA